MLLSVDVNAFAVAFPRTSLRLFFTGIYVITAFVFVLAPQFSYQLTMHSTYNSSLICQSLLCTGFIHSNLSPYCHHSFRVPSFARVTSDIALHNQSCLSLWSILLKQQQDYDLVLAALPQRPCRARHHWSHLRRFRYSMFHSSSQYFVSMIFSLEDSSRSAWVKTIILCTKELVSLSAGHLSGTRLPGQQPTGPGKGSSGHIHAQSSSRAVCYSNYHYYYYYYLRFTVNLR